MKQWAGGAKKRIKKALDVKGAASRAKTGVEKGYMWTAGKIGQATGNKDTPGFETLEQYKKGQAEKREEEHAEKMGVRAKSARSTDAYLRMLAKTSKEKRKRADFGTTAADLSSILGEGWLSKYKDGGSVMGQEEISAHYATEDYKAGGCVVTGGTAGDPVAIYNNKKG